jgi:hypothetical protein
MGAAFSGNCPTAVAKDAKYHVKREGDTWKIYLIYRINRLERALLATDAHPELVEMVNSAKEKHAGQPGGAFYINEFRHVLVPAGSNYFVAGIYQKLLLFDFEGAYISADPPEDLEPGDIWPGPHVGIPYVLCAGARDIRYELKRGARISIELLSNHTSESDAAELAQRLASVKGEQGGRIYINEQREFFAPVGSDYLYLGSLGTHAWFREPDVW